MKLTYKHIYLKYILPNVLYTRASISKYLNIYIYLPEMHVSYNFWVLDGWCIKVLNRCRYETRFILHELFKMICSSVTPYIISFRICNKEVESDGDKVADILPPSQYFVNTKMLPLVSRYICAYYDSYDTVVTIDLILFSLIIIRSEQF